ncbi:hypothetical protein CPB85DRAFT_1255428 [Mucidula mucida]|nr:hypothetical protein CPB85DRAFT_1255428 [Mucidula mucida]
MSYTGYHPSEYTDIIFRVLNIDRTGFWAPLEEIHIWYNGNLSNTPEWYMLHISYIRKGNFDESRRSLRRVFTPKPAPETASEILQIIQERGGAVATMRPSPSLQNTKSQVRTMIVEGTNLPMPILTIADPEFSCTGADLAVAQPFHVPVSLAASEKPANAGAAAFSRCFKSGHKAESKKIQICSSGALYPRRANEQPRRAGEQMAVASSIPVARNRDIGLDTRMAESSQMDAVAGAKWPKSSDLIPSASSGSKTVKSKPRAYQIQ